MSAEATGRRFLLVLGAENKLLARGDHAAAAGLMAEKQAAGAALISALKDGSVPGAMLVELRAGTDENADRLRHAMAVQSRILEMVAQATARARTSSGYARPGARSIPGSHGGALALAVRA